MSDQPLRTACIHGRYESHGPYTTDHIGGGCPGGRDITIDYEAAEALVRRFVTAPTNTYRSQTLGWGATVREVVDAAIGDTDE